MKTKGLYDGEPEILRSQLERMVVFPRHHTGCQEAVRVFDIAAVYDTRFFGVTVHGECIFVDELSAIKKQTDANYVALSYLLYQKNVDTAGPIYRRPDTPSDVALTAAIDAAHKLGIKAMIRPLVNADPKLADPEAPHTWRGMIGRNFTSAQWNSWFASYETMIYAAAEMASKAKADSLCVGGELIVASHQEAHWRSILVTEDLSYIEPNRGGLRSSPFSSFSFPN